MNKTKIDSELLQLNCVGCSKFTSLQSIHEDDLEPHDSGECQLDQEFVGQFDLCDQFDAWESTEDSQRAFRIIANDLETLLTEIKAYHEKDYQALGI